MSTLPEAPADDSPAEILPTELVSDVDRIVDADTDRLVDMFKDIHRNPELGFTEVRTARIVELALQNLGFDITTGIGKTGVASIYRNGDGPVVMYRADMDALAVQEETNVEWASEKRVVRDDGTEVPVAHVCGHDAHVTWMLGMAHALIELKDRWSGTLVLIGQPAEEPITGAKAMVDDGLYNFIPKPDVFIGMHTAPAPVGVVVSSPGPRLAGTDQLDVLFHGVGGHGSMPQKAKDPVLMAAMAVVEYQSIVSRMIDPQQTAVLTVGAIQAGSDNNVIPAKSLVKANLRWYDPAVREIMLDAVKAVSDGIARTYGMPEDKLPEITMKGGSSPLVNDIELSERMARTLSAVVGDQQIVTDMPRATGSEDVQLLKGPYPDMPFNYLLVGIANHDTFAEAQAAGEPFPFAPHNPNYLVDLSAIPYGAKVATYSMLSLLKRS
ncbi:N-alpha-acyl-glutamine aminoacylase [Gordonia neofelifaecis NRRL B-59395]|uniref:N-alpha-acyl-glutamine aminoacylase n=1 Tax=Gordonia neofelifaecis NRRL B-59395 TaxID=644548 RepID=F1YND2_9ACTN|nr:N-alpha-acyl-glutamine aminoacylase [Gordonia neofelifaecis NRRL B-59395]